MLRSLAESGSAADPLSFCGSWPEVIQLMNLLLIGLILISDHLLARLCHILNKSSHTVVHFTLLYGSFQLIGPFFSAPV